MKKSNSTRAVWAMPAISLDRTEAVKKGIAEAKKVCRDRNRFLEFGHVLSLLRQLYVSPEDLAAEFGCSKRRIYMMLSGHDAVKRRKVTKKVAGKLGFTRLSLLEAYLSSSPAKNDSLIEVALSTTTHDLQQALTSRKRGDTHEPRRILVLSPTERQHAIIEQALLKAGARRQGRDLVEKENALMALLEQAA